MEMLTGEAMTSRTRVAIRIHANVDECPPRTPPSESGHDSIPPPADRADRPRRRAAAGRGGRSDLDRPPRPRVVLRGRRAADPQGQLLPLPRRGGEAQGWPRPAAPPPDRQGGQVGAGGRARRPRREPALPEGRRRGDAAGRPEEAVAGRGRPDRPLDRGRRPDRPARAGDGRPRLPDHRGGAPSLGLPADPTPRGARRRAGRAASAPRSTPSCWPASSATGCRSRRRPTRGR